MRISDWSSDVCSSDLAVIFPSSDRIYKILFATIGDCDSDESNSVDASSDPSVGEYSASVPSLLTAISRPPARIGPVQRIGSFFFFRSEENTSELTTLMRNSYAVFTLQ